MVSNVVSFIKSIVRRVSLFNLYSSHIAKMKQPMRGRKPSQPLGSGWFHSTTDINHVIDVAVSYPLHLCCAQAKSKKSCH